MADADVKASAGSMACGDMITFYLKVKDANLESISFESFGCASNIATASALTERVKGQLLRDAFFASWKEIAEDLGGLPPVKVHCGVLAVGALRRSIRKYFEEHPPGPEWLPAELTSDEAHALEEEELAETMQDRFESSDES